MAVTPKVRNTRRPALERRAEIMTAARSIIAEKGHENISLSDIAQRAGIVEGTLYRFFENKQEMLVTVVEEWYEEISDTATTVDNIRGTWNKLRCLIARDLEVIKKHPELTRFILTEIRPDPNYAKTLFYKLNQRYTNEIKAVCNEAIESGEFREDVSAYLVRDIVFGCIEHSTWAYLRGAGDFSIDETADGIANVVYGGMLKHQPTKSSDLTNIVERLEKITNTLERDKTS